MIVPIPYVHMGMGAFTVLISLPLVLRMIPMNRVYGVRTKKAFASNRNWYRINAYGGKWLTVFGVFLFCFGYATRTNAPAPTNPWAVVYLVAPLLTIIPILVMIRTFERNFPDQ